MTQQSIMKSTCRLKQRNARHQLLPGRQRVQMAKRIKGSMDFNFLLFPFEINFNFLGTLVNINLKLRPSIEKLTPSLSLKKSPKIVIRTSFWVSVEVN